MNSRERVQAAVAHREPDAVPVDFGSTAVTGVHVSVVAALRERYGLERHPVKVTEPYQMLGEVEEDLKQAMGIDVEGVLARKTMFGFTNDRWKEWRTPQGLEVLVAGDFNTTVDARGDILIYPEGDLSARPSGRLPKDGYFFDAIVRQDPILDDRLKVEDNIEEFTPVAQEDIDYFAAATAAARNTGRFVIVNFGGTAFGDIALVPAPWMKNPKGIRDIAEWYMATTARRDYVHAIFDRQCDVAIANLERLAAVVRDDVDAVFTCGTDLGTQTSSFCSAQSFRELWMPYYQRLNDWIHAHTPWKVFKHSCGSVERFLPSFIEAGIDILNPVQCSARGMEASGLKSKYGDRLTFWGGGVDTQRVLPFGDASDVHAQALERCNVFARGGGFVFTTIHNIQACTPVENVISMLDAVREFNGAGARGTARA